jgi:hypothetical protein
MSWENEGFTVEREGKRPIIFADRKVLDSPKSTLLDIAVNLILDDDKIDLEDAYKYAEEISIKLNVPVDQVYRSISNVLSIYEVY